MLVRRMRPAPAGSPATRSLTAPQSLTTRIRRDHAVGLPECRGQLPEIQPGQGLDARGLRQPAPKVLLLRPQRPAEVETPFELSGQGQPLPEGPPLDGAAPGGAGHQHDPGFRTLVPDVTWTWQLHRLQDGLEPAQALDAATAAEGLCQPQGLVVPGLMEEGQGMGLE